MKEMLKRFGWDDADASNDLEAIYLSWVYGVSLEKLATVLDTTTKILRRLLAARYGSQATSLFSKSLLRSLAEDYPNDKVVEVFIRRQLHYNEPPVSYVATMSPTLPVKPIFGGMHRSQKGMNNILAYDSKTWINKDTLDRLGIQPSCGRRITPVFDYTNHTKVRYE